MKKIALILAAAVLAATSFSVQAETGIGAKDADKDGKISKAEWLAGSKSTDKEQVARSFGRIDKDENGFASLEEMVEFRNNRKGKNKNN